MLVKLASSLRGIVALGNLPDLRRAQFQISIGRSVVVMAVPFEADLARL